MSSRASETVLRMVDLLLSPLFRGAIVRVGSRGEILATHFPVKMLLMLIDPPPLSLTSFEALQYEIIKSWSAVMYILLVLQLECHNS
ncbi:Os02g0781850 [Oryza sativa Japonica Group]|uniref:Os02g0781850 protein n=1 Tax=Oryza sativa subsp. japonica TaxID=39947 RepID=A0A0P0VQM0_ORYSJ|nr:hypothetical protein EE612_014065 [Oryza sativa]BAS81227.1 Os02g0781850 [Oryza sativa Japonica Group]